MGEGGGGARGGGRIVDTYPSLLPSGRAPSETPRYRLHEERTVSQHQRACSLNWYWKSRTQDVLFAEVSCVTVSFASWSNTNRHERGICLIHEDCDPLLSLSYPALSK